MYVRNLNFDISDFSESVGAHLYEGAGIAHWLAILSSRKVR